MPTTNVPMPPGSIITSREAPSVRTDFPAERAWWPVFDYTPEGRTSQ